MKGLWKMDPKKGFVHDQSGLTKPKINFNWITTSYINHCFNLFFVLKLSMLCISLLYHDLSNVTSYITYPVYFVRLHLVLSNV